MKKELITLLVTQRNGEIFEDLIDFGYDEEYSFMKIEDSKIECENAYAIALQAVEVTEQEYYSLNLEYEEVSGCACDMLEVDEIFHLNHLGRYFLVPCEYNEKEIYSLV